jgi:hypothetical protein
VSRETFARSPGDTRSTFFYAFFFIFAARPAFIFCLTFFLCPPVEFSQGSFAFKKAHKKQA